MNILHIRQFFGEAKEAVDLIGAKRKIDGILSEDSLFPSMKRKSRAQRKKELWCWFRKNHEVCKYYNSYGFDIVDFRDQSDYIPYRQFRIERNKENFPSLNYVKFTNKIPILRDKITFSAFFGSLLGNQYVILSVGKILPDGQTYDFQSNQYVSLEAFVASHSGNLFVKKLNGECGDGCYLINRETNLKEFAEKTAGSTYLIQNQLQQHDSINKINASCVNSIRIITIMGSKSRRPQIFGHYMRFGGGDAVNDNRATGGLGVAISDDGHLNEYGVGHHAVSKIHPKTKVPFFGKEIPFWGEVKELVTKAHSLVPEIKTIGWDVAITPNGPVLIEGNDNWEISGAQDAAGGLKGKWYELRNS